ncbi:ABC transporter permease [Shimia sediminis]|uniref:ABC transporter permease n=1 Tax=Shimia sediminis TaxID=2497945 RepID=UPI000F8C36FA|nr:ABC transporter permease [Shimia sediminis]
MFQQAAPKSTIGSLISLSELIYHAIVRNVRKSHSSALMSILMNMLQAVIFVGIFYIMFSVLGLRGAALRGDFMIYVMSGIFLFMTHTKTMGAIVSSDGPSSPMMKHAPMNTVITISAAALSTLYIQVLSLFTMLFIYHVVITPVEIDQPVGAFAMLLLSWFTGIGVGVIFLAIKPWFPSFVSIASTIYQRANMIASGKMFVANVMPGYLLAMFDWNPLFHCIDQARGFAFINYTPRNSSYEYAFWVGIVLLMLGLMGEFYTRRHASLSWGARQ